ncbi:MAG TPA: ATP-binding protein [Steroidobacteraceae bacterium]|nr:ATP-binding protein [Steroidobacteraceae bacterium]
MFISAKRHEREKQELLDASGRITDAVLGHSDQGLFLLDAKDRIQPQVSRSLSALFRRPDFANLSFEKLLAPLVTAKTLTVLRSHIARVLGSEDPEPRAEPLGNIELRLPNGDGGFDSAHYSFEFHPVAGEPPLWLVCVADVTRQVQTARELEELQSQLQTQGEILRGVLQVGGPRFAALIQRIDASMKTINAVLKKPAREQDAFRGKLEEALEEVDRVRRDAAAFKISALESAARQFEDSLHDLRSRSTLSGSDFLPLAVKLDQLYGQFAALKSLTAASSPQPGSAAGGVQTQPDMTDNGTQVIQAPRFLTQRAASKSSPVPATSSSAPAGSLENTLRALTEHVAEDLKKTVVLDVHGLGLVPSAYQAAVKNVAIQLIRNAVMHGIESSSTREARGKPANGTLRLEFKGVADGSFELLFEDDGCGLDPDQVRATAIARGVIAGEGAARLRDREAIKLIFKSGYSTLESVPGEAAHGSGLSLVRRYVHEAGGKIAIASLLGHETRFKMTLPSLANSSATATSAADWSRSA